MSKRTNSKPQDDPAPQSSTTQSRNASKAARTAMVGLTAAVVVAAGAAGLVYEVSQSNAYIGTVDGQRIPLAEYTRTLASRQRQLAGQLGVNLGGPQGQQMMAEVKQQVVQSLVNRQIMLDEAASRSLSVSSAEVDAELRKIRSQFPDQQTFDKALAQSGFSIDALRHEVREGAIVRKLRDQLTSDATVSVADAHAYYEKNLGQFTVPEQVEASHILVKTLKEADDIEAKLKSGADFAALAKQYSLDAGSKDKGGDLGFFPRGRMVKPFEDAAFSLKPGQISAPVKSQFGYHIIKGGPHEPQHVQPFDQVRASIVAQLLQQKKDVEFQAWEAKARAGAKVVIRPRYAPLAPASGPGAPIGPAQSAPATR